MRNKRFQLVYTILFSLTLILSLWTMTFSAKENATPTSAASSKAQKTTKLTKKDVLVDSFKLGEQQTDSFTNSCSDNPEIECTDTYSSTFTYNSIEINNVTLGDMIRIYLHKGDDIPLLTVPVNEEIAFIEDDDIYGEVKFTNNTLQILFECSGGAEESNCFFFKNGGTLYLTKTQKDKVESDPFVVKYKAIPTSTLNKKDIIITNHIGTMDTVTVTGATEHDEIRIYNKAKGGELIGYIRPLYDGDWDSQIPPKHIGWELDFIRKYPLAKLGGTLYVSIIRGSEAIDESTEEYFNPETSSKYTIYQKYPNSYLLESKRVAIKYNAER